MSDNFVKMVDVDTCRVTGKHGAYLEARWTACSGSCGFCCKTVANMASVLDPETGQVSLKIPQELYDNPGIYTFSVGVMAPTCDPRDDADYRPVMVSQGIVLIEPSGFHYGNQNANCYLPTVADVRRKIDDFASKNDLQKAVEYSDYDIVHALIRAVQIWNETPPPLKNYVYNCVNYPFKDLWVEGAVAELLFASVMHYLRNKLQMQSGGLNIDAKNKDAAYKQIADEARRNYMERLIAWKYSINMNQVWGGVSSAYGVNRGLGYGF